MGCLQGAQQGSEGTETLLPLLAGARNSRGCDNDRTLSRAGSHRDFCALQRLLLPGARDGSREDAEPGSHPLCCPPGSSSQENRGYFTRKLARAATGSYQRGFPHPRPCLTPLKGCPRLQLSDTHCPQHTLVTLPGPLGQPVPDVPKPPGWHLQPHPCQLSLKPKSRAENSSPGSCSQP